MQAGKNITAKRIHTTQSEKYKYPCFGGNGLRGYVTNYNTEGTFSLVGRQGALCGNVNIVSGKFYATEHAVVTDGYGLTDTIWVYFFLQALNLNQYATATAQPGLAVSNIIEVFIPLPPIAEQYRIVEKIQKLLPIIKQYSNAQIKLNILNKNIKIMMRKSVLQEAIQGKLVPQDPNDEPASVLLQRIKEEKQRLVKEGKMKKKDIVDSIIYKGDDNKYYEQIEGESVDITEDIPFDVPEGWVWCRLKSICSIFTGATFKKEDSRTDQKGIRILRGGNILPFKITFNADDIFLSPNFVKENILLKRNDIVTPAVTSLENVGKMARIKDNLIDVTVGGFVFVLRLYYSDDWLSQYLLAVMSSPKIIEYIKSITNKSGQAFYNIGKERLGTTLLPLPPHCEQQRIVSKVEDLLGAINTIVGIL